MKLCTIMSLFQPVFLFQLENVHMFYFLFPIETMVSSLQNRINTCNTEVWNSDFAFRVSLEKKQRFLQGSYGVSMPVNALAAAKKWRNSLGDEEEREMSKLIQVFLMTFFATYFFAKTPFSLIVFCEIFCLFSISLSPFFSLLF